jgi:hypothetical protein
MDKFKVTREIASLLKSNKAISAIVGSQVFPVFAPEGTEGDFIFYQRVGMHESLSNAGVYDLTAVIDIGIISDNYTTSENLASLVYDTIEGEFSNPRMTIRLEDSTSDASDTKYIQILRFSIV